jgi:Tfp pilus assembly protein FimT
MNASKSSGKCSGISLMESSIVLFIFLALIAIAIPNAMELMRANRLTGDARGLARQLSLARQRAGTEFTWAEIVINNATTPISYTLQLCSTKVGSTCTTFTLDPGTGTQYLSSTTLLGFGSSSGGTGGQAAATTPTQTTTVIFNSRGIPVTSAGSPISTDTIYLADAAGNACAVSLTLSGHVNAWKYNGGWVQL